MADLVFRGVKNPANCSECFFWSICPCLADFDDYSAILDAVHDGNLVRHEKCPVSTLPEGHGRLIDADELAEDLQLDVENYQRALDDLNIVGIERERIQFDKDCKQNCMWYLSKCPTIVPAEGGADDGT